MTILKFNIFFENILPQNLKNLGLQLLNSKVTCLGARRKHNNAHYYPPQYVFELTGGVMLYILIPHDHIYTLQ